MFDVVTQDPMVDQLKFRTANMLIIETDAYLVILRE